MRTPAVLGGFLLPHLSMTAGLVDTCRIDLSVMRAGHAHRNLCGGRVNLPLHSKSDRRFKRHRKEVTKSVRYSFRRNNARRFSESQEVGLFFGADDMAKCHRYQVSSAEKSREGSSVLDCEVMRHDAVGSLKKPIATSTLLHLKSLVEISSFSIRQELLSGRREEAAGHICVTGSSLYITVLQRLPREGPCA